MNQGSKALRLPQRQSHGNALDKLREQISRIANRSGTDRPTLMLSAPEVEQHLPALGLACGTLHEVVAKGHGDRPGAFGFAFAVMASALSQRQGPAFSSPAAAHCATWAGRSAMACVSLAPTRPAS
jgi:hypothetical protein